MAGWRVLNEVSRCAAGARAGDEAVAGQRDRGGGGGGGGVEDGQAWEGASGCSTAERESSAGRERAGAAANPIQSKSQGKASHREWFSGQATFGGAANRVNRRLALAAGRSAVVSGTHSRGSVLSGARSPGWRWPWGSLTCALTLAWGLGRTSSLKRRRRCTALRQLPPLAAPAPSAPDRHHHHFAACVSSPDRRDNGRRSRLRRPSPASTRSRSAFHDSACRWLKPCTPAAAAYLETLPLVQQKPTLPHYASPRCVKCHLWLSGSVLTLTCRFPSLRPVQCYAHLGRYTDRSHYISCCIVSLPTALDTQPTFESTCFNLLLAHARL
jgi:hypothetical protein